MGSHTGRRFHINGGHSFSGLHENAGRRHGASNRTNRRSSRNASYCNCEHATDAGDCHGCSHPRDTIHGHAYGDSIAYQYANPGTDGSPDRNAVARRPAGEHRQHGLSG